MKLNNIAFISFKDTNYYLSSHYNSIKLNDNLNNKEKIRPNNQIIKENINPNRKVNSQNSPPASPSRDAPGTGLGTRPGDVPGTH